MSPYELSYIVRYILVGLTVFITWRIVVTSFRELRFTMRHSIAPVQGYFVMSATLPVNMGAGDMSFSLYHTSYIGSASYCDIRLKSRLIARRHAVIYYYDKAWMLRGLNPKYPIYVNGYTVEKDVLLESGDEIGIGEATLVFVDEKAAAKEAYLAYQNEKSTTSEKMAVSSLTATPFILINVFTLLGALTLLLFIPFEQRFAFGIIGLAFLLFLLITDIYYLLMPIICKQADRHILLILMQLAALGMLIQTRFDMVDPVGQENDVVFRLLPQAAALFFGLILLPWVIVLCAKTTLLEQFVYICAVITPLLLLLTLMLGTGGESHGATLWIHVGGWSLQLTELAKLSYLVVLAGVFKCRASRKRQIAFALWAGCCFFLYLLMPDMGSLMILLPTTLIVYLVMTSEYLISLAVLTGAVGTSYAAYHFFPHLQHRLSGWTSLWIEVNDYNRQVVYGLQALARGGLFGRGLGNGTPHGIPLASSDMIFTLVGEELGLLTGLCIVFLFIALFLRSARTSFLCRDGFSVSLALGIGTLFFVQSAVVISGATGLLPLTGATLPMIARGGSSMLATILLFGMLMGLSARRSPGGPLS